MRILNSINEDGKVVPGCDVVLIPLARLGYFYLHCQYCIVFKMQEIWNL